MLHFVDAARGYNQANSPLDAMTVTDLCWSIFDCIKAAGEGVFQGTIGTVINHPVETVLCVCAPEYLLAYHVGKIAYAYLDIKITSLMDQEAGEQKLAEYVKPFMDCVDTIVNGDITLRSSVKLAATGTTQILIQGKLNTGLKTFYETTKKRVKNYLKTDPAATAKQYLATPDGMLLKASGGPGGNGPSLRDMGGGGPRNASSSGNKAPHVEKTRNTFKVGNIHEFFKTTEFGKYLNKFSKKTKRMWNDHIIYEITDKKIKHSDLVKGDYFYLDKTHLDHIEVFNSNGLSKCVLNLDGTKNKIKTALAKGRNIKSSIR